MARGWIAAAVAGVLVCLVDGPTKTTATVTVAPSRDSVPGSALPFASIEDHHSIDHACTIDRGCPESGTERTKNNFCATGTPASPT
jgi:hypothetical protein